jgi:hypothetical protein
VVDCPRACFARARSSSSSSMVVRFNICTYQALISSYRPRLRSLIYRMFAH